MLEDWVVVVGKAADLKVLRLDLEGEECEL